MAATVQTAAEQLPFYRRKIWGSSAHSSWSLRLAFAGVHRRHLLMVYQVDCDTLQTRIFATIRERLLDVMALGTLEATQTCVISGTCYLFHGDPGLAWPVCGCALRIAQALHLHRK